MPITYDGIEPATVRSRTNARVPIRRPENHGGARHMINLYDAGSGALIGAMDMVDGMLVATGVCESMIANPWARSVAPQVVYGGYSD